VLLKLLLLGGQRFLYPIRMQWMIINSIMHNKLLIEGGWMMREKDFTFKAVSYSYLAEL
jgi:hypothetical protein